MSSNIQQKEFFVEAIIDKRMNIKGHVEYLVKWEDYAVEDSTWEPLENILNLKPLLEEYEKLKISSMTQNNISEDIQMEEILYDLEEDRIPVKVLSVKMYNNILICLCEFSESSTGIIPDPCYVHNSIIREKFPKILIDFYETKIKFINKKEN